MLAFALTFLTPLAGLLALAVVAPVAALVVATRRVERARRALRLPPPERDPRFVRGGLLAAVVLLLALAAMQPAVRSKTSVRARTDAAVFVVLDTSRSMLAAPSPGARTRLARAKRYALELGAQLPGIPLGVATFTDRVLPDLFPTPDRAAFDSTVESVTIESPPPRDTSTTATSFDALSALATENYFPPAARRRAAVLVTDGESQSFDPAGLADALAARGIRLAVVRVGGGADRVWRPDGSPEAGYRPDPAGAAIAVSRLRSALGTGPDAASAVRKAVASGPTRVVGVEPRIRTLSPLVALLALVPLGILLGVSAGWLRRVTSSANRRASRRVTA